MGNNKTSNTMQKLEQEVYKTLQMFIDNDLKKHGKLSENTLETINVQGYEYRNGKLTELRKVQAYVHSLKDKETDINHFGEVTIIEHKDNNNVIAEYNGVKCTAIFNPFVNVYYVDDIYGRIEDKQ